MIIALVAAKSFWPLFRKKITVKDLNILIKKRDSLDVQKMLTIIKKNHFDQFQRFTMDFLTLKKTYNSIVLRL